MQINKNKVVELTYELMVEGNLADKATEEHPLDYIQGNNMLLPRFEQELEGKLAGDTFGFTISPEEGYGPVDEARILDLPKSAFMIEDKIHDELLVVGKTIPMLNSMGQVVPGTVVAVKEEAVTMDFNHPMAGKTLNFSGKILSVREATEKELKEGLHGEFLPPEEGHHCCHGNCHGEGEGHCDCHGEDGHGECKCGEEGHGEGHGHCHGEGHGEGHGHCHGEGHGEGHGHCHGEGHGEGHGHGNCKCKNK